MRHWAYFRLLGRNASFDSIDRLWTFLLLGFEVFQIRLQKKATLALSIEIHKGAIFDCLKIKTVAILLR
jgi:hypothetical protein